MVVIEKNDCFKSSCLYRNIEFSSVDDTIGKR